MKTFEQVFNVNVLGALRVTKTFLPLISSDEKRNGRVIFMASLVGKFGCPMMAPYCSSKWAILGMAESLRYELLPHGINVSCILPDLYRTKLVTDKKGLEKAMDYELKQASDHSLKRYANEKGKAQMLTMIDNMEKFANPNLTPVINSILTSVTTKNPKKQYYPISWKSSIFTGVANLFPKLLDNLVTASAVN